MLLEAEGVGDMGGDKPQEVGRGRSPKEAERRPLEVIEGRGVPGMLLPILSRSSNFNNAWQERKGHWTGSFN